MNFYPFHIGDYAARTRHLSLMEDLAYRRMLDLYYTTEAPLPADPEKVARLIGMRDHTEIVSEILSEFFLKSEKGYENGRCDEEIGAYRAKADRAKSANKARWKHEKSNDFVKSDLKSESVQIPTINHEPLPDIKSVVGQKPDVVPQKEKEHRKNAIEVINFLNEKTGRKYMPVEANIRPLVARFKEGFTPTTARQIVAKKCREWGKDEKMEPYLRPATLFNATNFANYAGEIVPTGVPQ